MAVQLVVTSPSDLRRSAITTIPPRIDSTLALGGGEYQLTLGDAEFTLASAGTVLGRARYGDTLRVPGIELAIPARPGLATREIMLENARSVAAGSARGPACTS